MRIAVTRPEEDAGPLKAKLEAMGHEAVMAPLLTIVPRLCAAIEPLPYQAVAATSANGIRALSGHDHLKSIRMLTVGPQSLAAARQAGFANAEAHGGDVRGLARFVTENLQPGGGPILYLSGQETAGDLKGLLEAAGFICRRVVVYDVAPAATLGASETHLRAGALDAVLLYSPRSARIWRSLVEAHGLAAEASRLRSLCLSANAAAVLPQDWRIEIAERPDETHMLALLAGAGGTD